MSIDQFGNIAGAYVEVDGHAFNGVAFIDPTSVEYDGPEEITAISGRPFLQGPVWWDCLWDASNSDTFQTLYTIWNLKINSPASTLVAFGLHDPRNAMAFITYDCYMSQPKYSLSKLWIRAVKVRFTTTTPGAG